VLDAVGVDQSSRKEKQIPETKALCISLPIKRLLSDCSKHLHGVEICLTVHTRRGIRIRLYKNYSLVLCESSKSMGKRN